ncbi:MAG: class I SAM-dependent methyltransferase [Sphingomonadales bacterium]|nr:class I SAM-dependent methyltransferase [Sphingomonadales bacterium]MDE2167921.1 class I SAM-dependent methyltransferase [Sphingomonadales bacterium]
MMMSPAAIAAPVAKTDVAAAVADPSRPAEDRAMDEARHPADILAFLKLKPGETVADIWPGDYWDRLFSDVVGPHGTVYAVHLPQADKVEKIATPPNGAKPLAGHPNVIAITTEPTDMALPAKADVIWIRQNYHDLYDPFMGPVDVAKFNKAVYRALKPGGRFVIVDHVAPAGSKLAATNTTHRIDPAVVKADMAAAGFTFVGESKVLHNPADTHVSSVFDKAIRGHTDQFIYVFQRK